MSKTVVQVGKYYPPFLGGIENNTQQVAEALSKAYRSIVVCMRNGRGGRIHRVCNDVQVVELSSAGSIWRQELSESCVEVIEQISPDCVHFHAPNPLMAFYLHRYLNRNPDVKLVITHHADLERPEFIRRIANVAYRKLLDRAEWIITYSTQAFECSREVASYTNRKVIIPHGVSMPTHEPGRLTRVDGDSLVVGFLGRLEYWKGVHILIRAVNRLSNVILHVAGEGSYKKSLMQEVDQLGANSKVVFWGGISGGRKSDFFNSIQVLVLPSLCNGETFGQVLVEAQLSGIPVIASDLPTGIQEITDRGRAGLLFQPGDDVELAQILCHLMDFEARTKLAEIGRQRASRTFSGRVVSKQLLSFYKNYVFP